KVTAKTGDDHDGLPVTAVDPDEPPPGQQPVADQAGEGRPVEEGPRGYGQGDRAEQGRRHGPAVDVPGSAEDGRDGGGDGMAPDRTDEPGEQAPGEDDDGEKGGSGDDGRAEDDGRVGRGGDEVTRLIPRQPLEHRLGTSRDVVSRENRGAAGSCRFQRPRLLCQAAGSVASLSACSACSCSQSARSEEHTSELQSRENLVCR